MEDCGPKPHGLLRGKMFCYCIGAAPGEAVNHSGPESNLRDYGQGEKQYLLEVAHLVDGEYGDVALEYLIN